MEYTELVVVGGGPAGLAASVAAREAGIHQIIVLERDKEVGGILNQCIHNGFGLHTFREELTGPEYAYRYVDKIKRLGIECRKNSMVVDINTNKQLTVMSRDKGIYQIQTKAIILAMGCRERPRGALNIPGQRPAGIYTAGTAQYLVNMEGKLPGKEVVILGSGDIGLIMARRMTLEGANVKLVAELMPYSGGLKRNVVQCLEDYGIPLLLSHTVTEIHGKDRVTGVTLAKVEEQGRVIPGTEFLVACDTLLLSVGLIPENELSNELELVMDSVTNGPRVNESMETSLSGVFACGNVLHVHDLVDYVSEEATLTGKACALYLRRSQSEEVAEDSLILLVPKGGIRYTVPMCVRTKEMEDNLLVRFRVDKVYKDCNIVLYFDNKKIREKKKRILAPGEMEELLLSKEEIIKHQPIKEIVIALEP